MIIIVVNNRVLLLFLHNSIGITVTFDPTSYAVTEGDERVVVMVTMVGGSILTNVTVTLVTTDDTAIGTTSKIV